MPAESHSAISVERMAARAALEVVVNMLAGEAVFAEQVVADTGGDSVPHVLVGNARAGLDIADVARRLVHPTLFVD